MMAFVRGVEKAVKRRRLMGIRIPVRAIKIQGMMKYASVCP
jgi:hypothetical protein